MTDDTPTLPPDEAGPARGWPDRIVHYRIEREIGRGAHGVVLRAIDERLGRAVALKITHEADDGNAARIAGLRREAVTLASLNHPNIAVVHDVDEHEGRTVVVLELVEGRTLADVLAHGSLPPVAAARACAQVAGALAAVHARGLVHRDLKPSNVMMRPDGLVKVLDFGLARRAAPSTLTRTREISGTPGYASPEQLRGAAAGPRDDAWSFGCLLFECLAGRPAFPGATVRARIDATLAGSPSWSALPSAVPSAMSALVRDCLEPDPSKRLADLAEARRRLEAVIADAIGIGGDRSRRASNLPAHLSSFVGRADELAALEVLAATSRLLTITGVGGCGKTRLALELARGREGRHAGGAWLVELAPLTDPRHVVEALTAAFGIPERPAMAPIEALLVALEPLDLLLVLDNCEHVLEACAGLVTTILQRCPGLHVVATSREPLGVAGETTWRAPSLKLPASPLMPGSASWLDAVGESEAVRLFVERARAARPGFELTLETAPSVVTICQRLDGIPLALELAAARARILAVADLAARLDDVFRLLTGGSRAALPRQQALRATLDWSFDLLDEPERALYRRLAVFAGGWTLDAAEATCGGEHRELDVARVLGRLIDKSLVIAPPASAPHWHARHRLLETVRQHAREQLSISGEASTTRDRHRAWCLGLAENLRPELDGPHEREALDVLDVEHENMRAAWDWAIGAAEGAESAARLAVALAPFWETRAWWREGSVNAEAALAALAGPATALSARLGCVAARFAELRGDEQGLERFASEALAAAGEAGDPDARRSALVLAGRSAMIEGNYAGAENLLMDALALARAAGSARDEILSLVIIGGSWRMRGDIAAAGRYAREALHRARSTSIAPRILANALFHVVAVAWLSGETREAQVLGDECAAIQRSLGDRPGLARTLNILGNISLDRGDGTAAWAAQQEVAIIAREVGDRRTLAHALDGMGGAALLRGDMDAAEGLVQDALRAWREIGDAKPVATSLAHLASVAMARRDWSGARGLLQEALPIERKAGLVNLEANTLHELGDIAAWEGDLATARALLEEGLRKARSVSYWWLLPASLEVFARVAAAEGESRRAARLMGAAEAAREAAAFQPCDDDRAAQEMLEASCRTALGTEDFERERASGRALSRDEAVRLALRET